MKVYVVVWYERQIKVEIYWVFWSGEMLKCVWYCGSFCGCDLKKNYFIKNTFSWGWFDIYICLVKIVVEIEIEQKII